MELSINLVHDVLIYCPTNKRGTLKGENLFGFDVFVITENLKGFEVEFYNDVCECWTYECKFTDRGNRLVVTI